MIGQVLGKCRIESLIGSGAMGIVYRARHQSLSVPVAVKVIRQELSENEELLQRFLREAQLAARLRHPNVVRVYDVGEESGTHYIVMEMLEGTPLDEFLQSQSSLDMRLFFRLFYPLAAGLGEAHRNGIVHRDVKPANVIIVDGHKPILTDFGIAAALVGDSRLTIPGYVLGTPAYMSPEQARGSDELDSRSDVFALGIVMYETLTGKLPQFSENIYEQISRRTNESIRPLSQAAPHIPEVLANVVDRSLARKPSRRYKNGTELSEALSQAYQELYPVGGQATQSGEHATPQNDDKNRILSLPREETTPVADGVDIRYTDLYALFRVVENTETGHGVMILNYEGQADLILFAQGVMRAAFRWSVGHFQPVDLEDIVTLYSESESGVLDAFALAPDYYNALKTVLLTTPFICGMRAGFVDLLALFQHLEAIRFSGVVRLEREGTMGLIPVTQGTVSKILCSTWCKKAGEGQGLAPLAERLLDLPDVRIDVYDKEARSLSTGKRDRASSTLSDEGIDTLTQFLVGALKATGKALDKAFGLGSRPVMEKGLRLVAAEFPAVCDGLELDKSHSLDAAVLKSRIHDLPQTGRQAMVLNVYASLVESRVENLRETIRSKRKRKKAFKESLDYWEKNRQPLEDAGLAQPFKETFTRLRYEL